jgi:3-phenylpropionate/trans-cinnamate dioxygenase ferredoxin subunit
MYNFNETDANKLEFVPVASVDELVAGERMLLDVGGDSIALFNIDGNYYAIADVCSHDDGPLAEGELHDCEIACPRHGARFDLRTGKAVTLPAIVDIPAYPVRVVGEEILIGFPVTD